ncbi:MAG: hypothetical protein QXE31_02455 [Candidatus Woesearchaeota archaeon]
MSEIPWYAWIGVGLLVGIVSLFMGFLKPVSYDAFFKLMFFISIIMIIYGYIKMKIKEKLFMEELEKRRLSRGEREIEINMEDFRNKPKLNPTSYNYNSTNYSQSKYDSSYAQSQKIPNHYGTPRTFNNINQQQNTQKQNYSNPSVSNSNNLNQYTSNNQKNQINTQTNNQYTHHSTHHSAQMSLNQSSHHTSLKSHHQTKDHSQINYHYQSHSRNSQNTQRICPNCRTPLLKEHKYCPICNAKV